MAKRKAVFSVKFQIATCSTGANVYPARTSRTTDRSYLGNERLTSGRIFNKPLRKVTTKGSSAHLLLVAADIAVNCTWRGTQAKFLIETRRKKSQNIGCRGGNWIKIIPGSKGQKFVPDLSIHCISALAHLPDCWVTADVVISRFTARELASLPIFGLQSGRVVSCRSLVASNLFWCSRFQ